MKKFTIDLFVNNRFGVLNVLQDFTVKEGTISNPSKPALQKFPDVPRLKSFPPGMTICVLR